MASALLRDLEQDTLDALDDLHREAKLLSKKSSKDKTEVLRNCETVRNRAKGCIQAYQLELRSLSQEQQNGYWVVGIIAIYKETSFKICFNRGISMNHSSYLPRVAEWKQELSAREQDLDSRRSELLNSKSSPRGGSKKQPPDVLSRDQNRRVLLGLARPSDNDTLDAEQLDVDFGGGEDQVVAREQRKAIALGDQLQDKTEASLKRIQKMAAEAETLGATALHQMQAQEERLNAFNEDLDEIDSDLRRARQVIGQLAKGAAGDRCVQLLCVFISLALLLCLVLAMIGGDGGEMNVPDEVRRGD